MKRTVSRPARSNGVAMGVGLRTRAGRGGGGDGPDTPAGIVNAVVLNATNGPAEGANSRIQAIRPGVVGSQPGPLRRGHSLPPRRPRPLSVPRPALTRRAPCHPRSVPVPCPSPPHQAKSQSCWTVADSRIRAQLYRKARSHVMVVGKINGAIEQASRLQVPEAPWPRNKQKLLGSVGQKVAHTFWSPGNLSVAIRTPVPPRMMIKAQPKTTRFVQAITRLK